MKKWLIRCLTVLAMVCLIPGIVLNVKAADSIYTYCFVCMQQRNYEILGYTKVDSTKHRIHIKCSVCGRKNSIVYGDLSDHTGGTETPTCTTGKTCEKCGAEYGILGHKWKTPANASLGNGTHRIIACAAAYKVPQAVPVAQQPAPPKRSVRRVVGNTAKET